MSVLYKLFGERISNSKKLVINCRGSFNYLIKAFSNVFLFVTCIKRKVQRWLLFFSFSLKLEYQAKYADKNVGK